MSRSAAGAHSQISGPVHADSGAGPHARSVRAAAVLFAINGLSLGSWLSRIPAAQNTLGLSVQQMGYLLLAPGIGSVIGMPIAGQVVARAGPRRSMVAGAAGIVAALGALAVGLQTSRPVLAAVGLALYGLAISVWDVAMNVTGAQLEHNRAKPVLPRLHAYLSLGTIIGSGGGVLAARASLSVAAQAWIVTAVIAAGSIAAIRQLPGHRVWRHQDGSPGTTALSLTQAWREPRTVLIGVTVLAFALCEGIAGSWLALAVVDGHQASQALGASAYMTFAVALTAGRGVGSVIVGRLGRTTALRALAVLVIVGVSIVVFVANRPLVFVGCALWGFGTSLGFPIGISAAGDDPVHAPIRVSVVSWIGYGAFFAGPPLIGSVGSAVGILRALLCVPVAAVVAAITAGSLAPTAWAERRPGAHRVRRRRAGAASATARVRPAKIT